MAAFFYKPTNLPRNQTSKRIVEMAAFLKSSEKNNDYAHCKIVIFSIAYQPQCYNMQNLGKKTLFLKTKKRSP
jgi:hypothetical protein